MFSQCHIKLMSRTSLHGEIPWLSHFIHQGKRVEMAQPRKMSVDCQWVCVYLKLEHISVEIKSLNNAAFAQHCCLLAC